MSGICTFDPTATPAYRTTTELRSSWSGTPSIVGAIPATILSAGTATAADITTIITTLGAYVPAAPTSQSDADIQSFMDKDSIFITKVQQEYCHYFGLYAAGINQLLACVMNSNNLDGNGNTFASINAECNLLNTKLNIIAQVIQKIADQRKTSLNGIKTNLDTLNAQLGTASTSLSAQQAILTKEKGSVQLYKEMEQYSREKSKYTNNLLMLYSFLNITALGLLFYVYRAA
jgi:hypothetical protein